MRSRTDRKIAGVAGGLGRYFGIDPLIFRIALVVLALFGGSGLLIYAIGWLFIRDEGRTHSDAQQLAQGRGNGAMIVAIVIGVIGLIYLDDSLGRGWGSSGFIPLVGIALAAYAGYRVGHPAHPSSSGWAADTSPPSAPGAYGQTPGTAYAGAMGSTATDTATYPTATYATATYPPAGYTAGYFSKGQSADPTEQMASVPDGPSGHPVSRTPRRKRSALGRLTLSAALLVAGILAGLGALTSISVPAAVVLAAALTVVGAGLVVGAVYGRSRWLVVLGILLALSTAAASVSHDGVSGGLGTRTWNPQTMAQVASPYELGTGDAVLDLRDLDLSTSGRLPITAHIGAGHLQVLAPAGVPIDVEAHVGVGQIRLPDGTGPDGVDNNSSYSDGRGTGGPIVLKLWVGAGNLEVRNAGF